MGPKQKKYYNESDNHIDYTKLVLSVMVTILTGLTGYQQSTVSQHSEEIQKIVPQEQISEQVDKTINNRLTALEAKYMSVDDMHKIFITRGDLEGRFEKLELRFNEKEDGTVYDIEVERDHRLGNTTMHNHSRSEGPEQ